MADTARALSAWSLDGTVGALHCDKFSGELDVAQPHAGLRQPQFDFDDSPCSLIGVMRSFELAASNAAAEHRETGRWPLPVADVYVRGNDLVASYQPTAGWPYSPQIYWQAMSSADVPGSLAAMSLLISVQTQLLDTCPKILVASQVPSSELFYISTADDNRPKTERIESDRTITPRGANCCVLRRLLAEPLSYVEIMPSTDFRQLTCTPEPRGKQCAEWHLFADFLEKGVIRRARAYGALLPRKNDIELALECCSKFERSPLPLTA
jgi:hypothetical protein